MEEPARVNIGTKHTQNSMDTPFENSFDKEECGQIVDDEGDQDQGKFVEIVYNVSTVSPTQVTICGNHTHNTTDTPFNKNCSQVKGGDIFDYQVDNDQEKGGDISDDEGNFYQ